MLYHIYRVRRPIPCQRALLNRSIAIERHVWAPSFFMYPSDILFPVAITHSYPIQSLDSKTSKVLQLEFTHEKHLAEDKPIAPPNPYRQRKPDDNKNFNWGTVTESMLDKKIHAKTTSEESEDNHESKQDTLPSHNVRDTEDEVKETGKENEKSTDEKELNKDKEEMLGKEESEIEKKTDNKIEKELEVESVHEKGKAKRKINKEWWTEKRTTRGERKLEGTKPFSHTEDLADIFASDYDDPDYQPNKRDSRGRNRYTAQQKADRFTRQKPKPPEEPIVITISDDEKEPTQNEGNERSLSLIMCPFIKKQYFLYTIDSFVGNSQDSFMEDLDSLDPSLLVPHGAGEDPHITLLRVSFGKSCTSRKQDVEFHSRFLEFSVESPDKHEETTAVRIPYADLKEFAVSIPLICNFPAGLHQFLVRRMNLP